MNNMLVGVIPSTLSLWGIKIRHPFLDWSNNINFIFIATWSQTRSNVRVAANYFYGHFLCLKLLVEGSCGNSLHFRVCSGQNHHWCESSTGCQRPENIQWSRDGIVLSQWLKGKSTGYPHICIYIYTRIQLYIYTYNYTHTYIYIYVYV